MSRHYDVIVAGLGAMGSAALYHLARRGARVLGVDRFDPPHALGSSHGESRIIRQVNGEGEAYFALVRRAFDLWRELEEESGDDLLYTTGGLVIGPRTGGTVYHGQRDFVVGTAALAGRYAVEHSLVDSDGISTLVDALTPSAQEHAYVEPGGGLLRPERAIGAHLALARRRGATVLNNTPVLSYTIGPDAVTVQTTRGAVQADRLILAAGAWMGDLMPLPIADALGVYRQCIYWFAVDDPDRFLVERFPWIIWIGETAAGFLAIFPTVPGGTPGLKVATEQYLVRTVPERLERTVTLAEITATYRTLVAPRVAGVRLDCLKAAACAYTVTPDEHFVIDFHPESDRVVVASPCSGHGFKHSAAIGEILCQLALDKESKIDIKEFALQRPALASC